MKNKFKENGGKIDAVYFCPHHSEYGIDKYKKECNYRKPAPGMLLEAQKDFGINFSKSILVGDKISDIQAGAAVGIAKLLCLNCSYKRAQSIKSIKEILYYF